MLAADVTVDAVKPARVHDIRHSYAVAALSKMQADGMDSYTCLPLLATFMGHRDVTSTEYYLRLTGSHAAQLAAENGAAHLGLYPEVD
jgi:integrase